MSKSEARGSLHVTAPGADIQVLDAYLRPVPDAKGVGAVQVTLPPGAYTVVSGLEGTSVSHDLLVRPGSSNDVSLEVPLAPAAPVSRFPTANETHGELAHELSRARPPAGASALIIVLRGLRGHEMAPLEQSPEITDWDGAPIALPAPTFDPHVQPPRAVGWRVDLDPGAYRVRWTRIGAQPAEHTAWAAPDRKTVLFVPQGQGGPDVAGMSMHLLARTRAYDPYRSQTETVERALSILRRGARRASLEDAERMLSARTPLTARLFAAAALATRADATSDRTRSRVADTVRRLHDELGDVPDVLALGRAVSESGVAGSADVPPMLSACMDLLLAADRDDPDVIPAGSLVETASGERYACRPWLLWRPLELPAEAGFDELPMMPPAPGAAPATAAAEPVSPTVMRRVEEVVVEAAPRLELPAHEAAAALGAEEIAHRLEVPTALVERSLANLYG
ncbi:hypothetical protein BCL57_000186 [Agromyces flavus]|uniref:Uncharacterized protein n=1 Tax=Agromyces flavus TaxID=589382 RepID=A0A1H1VY93_9MICO|nr:hypothetical protein [Agromyces flavus]MCP2366044.1 hypothetical protein [Agromyces flavus]GGI43887.1 hypothetical protein GCM10010932_01840 [Agromyces flavus]SDS89978.1 hypothetical protein SAMN04489721_2117 [Agromyces flavus]